MADDLGQRWVMAVAAGDHIEFYRSPNLISWSKTGEFTTSIPGSSAVWECPDLIELGHHGPARHALLVSTNDAGPHGHSGVVAFAGAFDGSTFSAVGSPCPLDYGPDFYAVHTFTNHPGPPLAMAWMNSWNYADRIPSNGRRGVLSAPRRLGRGRHHSIRQRLVLPPALGHQPVPSVVSSQPAQALALTMTTAEFRLDIRGCDGPASPSRRPVTRFRSIVRPRWSTCRSGSS